MKNLHTDAYSELVGNVLYVNSNIAVLAQRYAIANTIGELIMEQYANALAQQLLMPKIVVQQTIRYAIETQHLDQNYLSEDDYKLILSDSSKILGVSYNALHYRVKNLQLFETGN